MLEIFFPGNASNFLSTTGDFPLIEQAKRDRKKDAILAKYGLPLIRFSTTVRNEKKILTDKLNEIIA